MDARRFDTLTRSLSARLSRRTALATGTAGLATGMAALGTVGLGGTTAQDATPGATPAPPDATDRTSFLFVQTFASGTIVPHSTEADLYTLTVTGGPDQTVYFSDRPERIVGTVPTTRFLDGLGFTPDNPPNAALVAQTQGGEEIMVVELLDPVYEERFEPEAAVTLTYDVRIPVDYAEQGLAHLAERRGDAAPPEAFGAASLFIDDCADADPLDCYDVDCNVVGNLGTQGMCWHFGDVFCEPCIGYGAAAEQCNALFPACNDDCHTPAVCL